MVVEQLAQLEQTSIEQPEHRLRKFLGNAALVIGCGVAGAAGGAAVGLETPAHLELAGSPASVWLEPGRSYDQAELDSLLIAKRSTSRQMLGDFLGEPLGLRIHLDIDPTSLQNADGTFNADVLPAYVQLFSDPEQLGSDISWAVEKHFIIDSALGAGVGIGGAMLWLGYRRYRKRYDAAQQFSEDDRAHAQSYFMPERRFARLVASGLAISALLDSVAASGAQLSEPEQIVGNPLLADTSFRSVEIDGIAQPALKYIKQYVDQYIDQTNQFYTELNATTIDYLTTDPLTLPAGPNIVNFMLASDRHCNIGMDRIVATVMDHYDLKLLVLAGDDDFSGSFPFEAACTAGLAEKLKKIHATAIQAPGNHDSSMTIGYEQDQGIKVLQNNIISAEGLRFVGSPDPRTSRWGEGLMPADESARTQLLIQQGRQLGALACQETDSGLIVVTHDPAAGKVAIENSCNNITLSLNGHLHRQIGPTAITLPDGTISYQFVSGTSGGTATAGQEGDSITSPLSVGPLQHNAPLNIMSVDKTSGQLVAVSELVFTPTKTITASQRVINPLYFELPDGRRVIAKAPIK